jgi:Xaa-Pro aminopeptidase
LGKIFSMINVQTRLGALTALRKTMQENSIAAYLVPSNDPHQSEYVPDHWKARQWLSGFSGSAGILVITADHAGLWTDGRYFIQAEAELASGPFVLHRQLVPHAPEHVQWLAENLPTGSMVACDAQLFSVKQIRYLEKQLQAKGLLLMPGHDLITGIWAERPALPEAPVFEHDEYFGGQSRAEKLAQVRAEMHRKNCQHHLVCTLEDLAWVLNLRGQDVEFTPVFVAYLLIGVNDAHLFIDARKVPNDLQQALYKDGVKLKPYADLRAHLQSMSKAQKVLIDPSSTSIHLYEQLGSERVKEGENLIQNLKAIKNPTEIHHLRQAMKKDGVALIRAFRWLENALAAGETPSEYDLALEIGRQRALQADYVSESFPAIVGYQGNGAIIHYRPEKSTAAKIKPEGILLVDCGAQYLDGTTDITRTLALGNPTAEQKKHYTLVLKGHIGLAKASFPAGTLGIQLDVLARQHLWQEQLNYQHGTGHGVGFFLSVHEGPQGFAAALSTSRGSEALKINTLSSNEPGFYQTNEYGIRIENLILCVEKGQGEHGLFLGFETLTLMPIDLQLIDFDLLDAAEEAWLEAYHQQVLAQLGPLLTEDELAWLKGKVL